MDRFEKYIKNNINKNPDYEPSDNLKEKIFKNVALNSHSKVSFFKKNLFKFTSCFACIALFIVVGIVLIFSTNKVEQYSAIIEIDVNPEIEMVINEKNEVISIKGLNDEGKMVILEEDLKGKNITEVLSKIIEIETNMGYLNNNLALSDMTISITNDKDDIIKKIQKTINESITSISDSKEKSLNVYYKEGKSVDSLKQYAASVDPTLTIEKISHMSYDAIIKVISDYHNEVAEINSVDLEKMYLETKKQNAIKMVENAYYNNLKMLDNTYSSLISQYDYFYNLLIDTYSKLQNEYKELTIDSDSLYQKTLKMLNDKKEEIIKQKKLIAIKKQNGEYVKLEEIILSAFEEQYKTLEVNLKVIKQNIDDVYNSVLDEASNIFKNLNDVKEKLKDVVDSITIDNILNSNEALNEYKTQQSLNFIKEYSECIEYINSVMRTRKSNLLNSDK